MFRHLVHFYDGAYPAEEACDFIEAGLRVGDTCIVMLTQANRQGIDQVLEARRLFSTPCGPHAGQYVVMDTHEALAGLMVDGRLDKKRAAEALGTLLNPATHGSSAQVRLVGDPAPTLFASGNEDDALALEALVGKLCAVHCALVFCAYSKQDLHVHGNPNSLSMLCAAYSEAAIHVRRRTPASNSGHMESSSRRTPGSTG